MEQSETFDVVVVGGGPAGATAAHDLARQGHSVLLLDRAGRIKPCGGAIPPRLIKDFEMLFSWRWVDYYSSPSLEDGASGCYVVRLQNLRSNDRQIDTYLVLFYFFISINFNNRTALDKAMEAVSQLELEADATRQGIAQFVFCA
jgi:hypothetical protein